MIDRRKVRMIGYSLKHSGMLALILEGITERKKGLENKEKNE